MAYASSPDYQIWCLFAAFALAPIATGSLILYLAGKGERSARNFAFFSVVLDLFCILIAWDDVAVKAVAVLLGTGCILLINWKMNRVAAREWRDSIDSDE